jgi:hypothetical protein
MIPSCFKLYYNFYFEVIRKFDWYNTVGKSMFVVSKAFSRELFVGLAAKSHFADSHVHTWRKAGLRLSPTMRANCSFASQVATVHARKASNREGIARCILPAEERGEAKMHSLSPRRQTASARTSSTWRWRGASAEEEHRREASTVEERQREVSAAEERTLSRQPPAPSSPSLRAAGDPLCRTAMASAPPEVGPGDRRAIRFLGSVPVRACSLSCTSTSLST